MADFSEISTQNACSSRICNAQNGGAHAPFSHLAMPMKTSSSAIAGRPCCRVG